MGRKEKFFAVAILILLVVVPSVYAFESCDPRPDLPEKFIGQDLGDERWLQFGPYKWGRRFYSGTLILDGIVHPHLLMINYPADIDGVDVPVSSEGPFPVIFFEHAGGDRYDWYDYLFSRLASHGMIVVSADHSDALWETEPRPPPGRFWPRHRDLFLRTIALTLKWNEDPDSFLFRVVDHNRMALAGHSHGGGAALLAALTLLRHPEADVKILSVSLLAPCPREWDSMSAYPTVYAGMPPLQVIYGSKDQDGCVAYGQAIASYELETRSRHYAYVVGASHHGFSDHGSMGAATITRQDHHRAAASAMVAWHALTLKGDQSAIAYLRGDTPLLYGQPEVRYQFHDSSRLVIDDFEGNTLLVNSLGLPVVPIDMETFDELFTYQPDRTLYHPTHGLEFAWTEPGARFSQIVANESSDGLDATTWGVLSFRVLQLFGDPLNPPGKVKDFHVVMTDWDGHSAGLALSDTPQGPLRYPASPAPGPGWKSVFETYRLPLAAFRDLNPELDLSRLKSIDFVLDITPTGRVFIDDIEFAPRSLNVLSNVRFKP